MKSTARSTPLARRAAQLAVGIMVMTGLVLSAGTPVSEAAPKQRKRPAIGKLVPAPGAAAGAKASTANKFASSMSAAPVVRRTAVSGKGTISAAQAQKTANGLAQAGSLPVWVGSADAPAVRKARRASTTGRIPAQVSVTAAPAVVTEQLGTAAAFEVAAASGGALGVQVSTTQLGLAADGLSRARLVQLPVCSLTTPTKPECRTATDLGAVVDEKTQRLTTTLAMPAASSTKPAGTSSTVMAVQTSSAGTTGDFGVPGLNPAGEWSAGGNSGDFTWSYDLDVPAVGGGLAPAVGFTYSAASIDGRTTSTNNQPSWVGEGWSLGESFIERRYVTCADDVAGSNTSTKTDDLCWDGDNATVSFGPHSGELVQDGTTSQWRLRDDDGTRFEKLNASWANSDNDSEYWRVTTADGTQYYFGYGRPSSRGGDTKSAWSVPVFGNHDGEPCHAESFADSHCQQAWRWNLDRVIDVHGNSMAYYYQTESNNYGRNNKTAVSTYVRGGWLDRIEYGHRAGSEDTTDAPAQVRFSTAERCLPTESETCSSLTSANAQAWPDVPQDLICTSTTSCAKSSPSFFTRKRLTVIRTEILSAGVLTLVKRWDMVHQFPDPGDGTSAALWLSSITPRDAGTATMPPAKFWGTQMDSRVDGVEDTLGQVAPPMIKYRITGLQNGQGQELLIRYSTQDCSPTSLPTAHTNTRRCFPVYWTAPGRPEPTVHWFHKYVATEVTTTDLTLDFTPQIITTYQYSNPGWGYDESPLTPNKYRTWSRWAGYSTVSTIVGPVSQADSLRSKTVYFRGLSGDRENPDGGTKTVTVTDSTGTEVDDARMLQGKERETITYNGTTGPEVAGQIIDWRNVATSATNARGRTAQQLRPTRIVGREPLAAGGERTTRWAASYDTQGYPIQIEDLADALISSDNSCTKITYAHNTTNWVMGNPATVQHRANSCAGWPAAPTAAQIFEDVRYTYDGLPLGQAGDGLVSKTEEIATPGENPTYTTTQQSTYDSMGRPKTITDAMGAVTTVAYTPSGAGIPTGVSVTSPDPDGGGALTAHVTTATLDPRWGETTKLVEPGGETTETTYDTWGRPTAIWEPGRAKATQTASTKYSYLVSATRPNTVTTQTLLHSSNYLTSVSLFDGLGRERQVQQQEIDQYVDQNGAVLQTVGRRLQETHYDDRGLATEERGPIFSSGAPSTTYLEVQEVTVPRMTRTAYDGAGRPISETLIALGATKWATTTAYAGEQTKVTPPSGGTATTTVVDARGLTTALRQHHTSTPAGDYDESTYSYDAGGRMTRMRDAAGNSWSWAFDVRGRHATATDPDSGTRTYTYNNADEILTVKDARNLTLAYTYDAIGRKTSLRDTSPTGAIRATWSYDTVKKGHLHSSSRMLAGQPVTTTITSRDTAGRPTYSRTTIPVITDWIEAALAKTYDQAFTYFPDGSLDEHTYGTIGNLNTETISYTYDAIGRPNAVGGNGSYVNAAVYSGLGPLIGITTGSQLDQVQWTSWEIDQSTGRIAKMMLDRSSATKSDYVTTYSYTRAGTINKLSTATPQAGGTADTQCFSQDYLQRLTQAWTPANGACSTAPTVAGLGGPAPYWRTWTFDDAGNRLSQVDYDATGNTTTTWTHPAPGSTRPHAPISMRVAPAGQTAVTSSYAYDATGNTTARTSTAGSILNGAKNDLDHTYNAEGRLERAIRNDSATTRFADNADGERLLRRDSATTTLYLDGGTELTLTRSTGALTAVRYITFNDQTVAVRTSNSPTGTYTLWNDLNNTASWQVNHETGAITTRRTHPYGEPRGTTTGWKGTHGFVDGLDDHYLGITRIGARDYDPATGRFLTPDPLLDTSNPNQWNSYHYANNNPVSFTDPDGLSFRPTMADGDSSSPGVTLGSDAGTAIAAEQGMVGLGMNGGFKGKGSGGRFRWPWQRAVKPSYSPGPGKVVNLRWNAGPKSTGGLGRRAFANAAGDRTVGDGARPVMKPPVAAAPPSSAAITSASSRSAAAQRLAINQRNGNAARDRVAARFKRARPEASLTVKGTNQIRRIDVLVQERLAFEVKVGRTSMTKRIRAEIEGDRRLLENGQVDSVTWVFERSPVTGKSGPTRSVREALKSAGIKIEEI